MPWSPSERVFGCRACDTLVVKEAFDFAPVLDNRVKCSCGSRAGLASHGHGPGRPCSGPSHISTGHSSANHIRRHLYWTPSR